PKSTSTSADESSKAPSSNVVVQMKLEDKDKPSEETPMSTETKSSGGFWIKVAFWLIIIILGFMYIRSLAKSPAAESAGNGTESEQVEATASHVSDAAEEATGSNATNAAVAETTTDTSNVAAEESSSDESNTAAADASSDQSNAVAEDSGSETSESAAADSSSDEQGMVSKVTSFFEKLSEGSSDEDNSSSASSEQAEESTTGDLVSGNSLSPEVQVVPEKSGQHAAADPATTGSNQSPQAAAISQEQQSVQDLHSESVTKILKEFDELRDAAQAEMEAKKNRMQAERELHEAMMPTPRMWRNPGYNTPYGSAPYQQGPNPYQQQGLNPYQQGPNPYQQGYYNYR
ncbi:MAG: hypothetical protein ABW160_20055, partial [Candidatus Thiodiazotropha sp. 4PDIV1]